MTSQFNEDPLPEEPRSQEHTLGSPLVLPLESGLGNKT